MGLFLCLLRTEEVKLDEINFAEPAGRKLHPAIFMRALPRDWYCRYSLECVVHVK